MRLLILGAIMIAFSMQANAWSSCNVGTPCVLAFRQTGVPNANMGGYMWGIPTEIGDNWITLKNVSYLMPPALIPPGISAQWALNGDTPNGLLRLMPSATLDVDLSGGVISWKAAAKKLP